MLSEIRAVLTVVLLVSPGCLKKLLSCKESQASHAVRNSLWTVLRKHTHSYINLHVQRQKGGVFPKCLYGALIVVPLICGLHKNRDLGLSIYCYISGT